MLAEDGREAEALALFERALAAEPAYWPAALGLADLLGQRAGTRPRALRVLESALRTDPENPELLAAAKGG